MLDVNKLPETKDNYLMNIAFKNAVIKSWGSSEQKLSSKRRSKIGIMSADTSEFHQLLDIIETVNPEDFKGSKHDQRRQSSPPMHFETTARCSKMHGFVEDKSKPFYRLDPSLLTTFNERSVKKKQSLNITGKSSSMIGIPHVLITNEK